ncbi:scavenger receptor class B member 1-like [Choristoneura fumiferana]|uniref:scavenger receptor class B member 1-like n=1 Tax=Choristoneura fumiferana TaxID=7141 RepID=UPI003D154966
MTIQNVPSKGRISIIKFQNFTIQRRKPVIRLVYGTLLVCIGIIMVTINPIEIVTNWKMEMRDGSYVMHMWENPTYQLFSEVWIFNYTNVPEYLDGTAKKLRVEEVGPFIFQESRTNENVTVDKEKGVMNIVPKITLKFLPEQSLAHTKDVEIYMPNIALIAISTVAADRLPYLANAGLYYSISAFGSKLFRNMTAHEFFWGFTDPIVTAAHNMMPGWIDFDTIGIMDRFYSEKPANVELELKDVSRRWSINSWDHSSGISEQGFTDLKTSTLCNRIKGSYEGLMISPKITKDRIIPLYRRQACRIFPLTFAKEIKSEQGFDYYRYIVAKDAFSRKSPYACNCTSNCLPEGFVDISGCFYGKFPCDPCLFVIEGVLCISPFYSPLISFFSFSSFCLLMFTSVKLNFIGCDRFTGPVYCIRYANLTSSRVIFNRTPIQNITSIISFNHYEVARLILGVPVAISSKMQVNVAVRMSSGNPVTRPLKDKVLPLVWLQLYCKEAPEDVLYLLRLRFVIAPPLVITVEVLLFVIGFILGVQGAFRLIRPKYKLREIKNEAKNIIRRTSLIVNISENKCYREEDEKETVSLLSLPRELENLLTTNT